MLFGTDYLRKGVLRKRSQDPSRARVRQGPERYNRCRQPPNKFHATVLELYPHQRF